MLGRDLTAKNCNHDTRLNYAKGMCHSCYNNTTKRIRTSKSQKYQNIDFVQKELSIFNDTDLLAALKLRKDT